MTRGLTKAQWRVLCAAEQFVVSERNGLVEECRPVLDELLAEGLIEIEVRFVPTPAGRAALQKDSGDADHG